MRGILVWFAVAGCYGPSAPSGSPCDPEIGNCPGDQICRAEAGGFYCGGELAADAAPSDAITADAQPIDAPEGATRVTYRATVAECANPTITDPSYCRSLNGTTQLVVDNKDSTTEQPWYAFVRFDIDDAIEGKTIERVALRMVATSNSKAPGPNSGDVWRVESFTLASLRTGQLPERLGGAKIAGSQGPVTQLATIEWPLPTAVVEATRPTCLGIYLTTSDGVNYWNTDGAAPPELVVDLATR